MNILGDKERENIHHDVLDWCVTADHQPSDQETIWAQEMKNILYDHLLDVFTVCIQDWETTHQ